MKRKDFLKKAALGGIAGSAILTSCGSNIEDKAPAIISNKKYKWKMVTTWPPNFPVVGEIANLMSEWIYTMSGGRMKIEVYGGGELVPALESFDAVSIGAAEMGCGASYYWVGKVPASQFFTTIPFGMNAQQMAAWLIGAGGMDLWNEVYAPFDLIPFAGGNTGVQMGGWFNKRIDSIDDLKGLKMRIPGMGGKVLNRAGGAAVLVAGGEIYTSLERGVIDATEWIGPYHDYKMGFHKIAKYYYTPGWHETGSQLEFFANKTLFENLPKDLQIIIETATMRAQAWVLAEFDAKNGRYLKKIKEESEVQVLDYPTDVLSKLRVYTNEVIEELIETDALSKKVFTHLHNFRKEINDWSKLTEKVFYNDLM